MNYRDFITRLQVSIESLKANEVDRFAEVLANLDSVIVSALVNDELVDMTPKQLNEVLLALADDISVELSTFSNALYESSVDIANHVTATEVAFIASVASTAPKAVKVTDKIADLPVTGFGGASVKTVLSTFEDTEKERIINAIRLARHQGKTNAQISQIIRGTRKNNYQDGILNITARNAKAVTNTTVQHMASEARAETARKLNITEIKVVATLDGRTSSTCRSLDGKILPLEQKPPYHVNCRTSYIFWTGVDPKLRSSLDGTIKYTTYYEWLATQDPVFQDQVLGAERGQMFRDGGISPKKFAELQLDRNFRPRTLKQIKELL